MQIQVVHPAHVRHRPRGARNMRDSLVRVSATASLRTASPRDLSYGPDVRLAPLHFSHLAGDQYLRKCLDTRIAFHEGTPYLPLTYTDGIAGRTVMPTGSFLEFLRGDLFSQSRIDGCAEAFSGTPLRDLEGFPALRGETGEGRGIPFDPEAQREVAIDGRGAAVAALAAFLDAEILVAGDTVLRRFRPLLRIGPYWSLPWQVPATGRPDPLFCTPALPFDRIDEARARKSVMFRQQEFDHARAECRRLAAALPAAAPDDEDLRIGIASIAGSAAQWLAAAARDPQAAASRGDVEAEADAFAPLHMALRIGQEPACGWSAAATRILRAIDVGAAAVPAQRAHGERVAEARRYLSRAIRRIAASAPQPDADALSDLAPR